MKKVKHYGGYLGCRTTANVEWTIKSICAANHRSVSEVVNYLCRLFIEDSNGIRTKFLGQAAQVGGEPPANNSIPPNSD